MKSRSGRGVLKSRGVLKKGIWRNWARTETSKPKLTLAPQNLQELTKTVTRAITSGHRIKTLGAGHSFTAIAATDSMHVSLRNMRGLLSVDKKRTRVTVWAGTHLWELTQILDAVGMALPNMGDIDAQTISGATQTGTHGTGLGFGGLATMIVGLTMIDGNGNLTTITETDKELLNAAALGLGALGIVVTVTLQLVPKFLLKAEEAPAELEDVLLDYLDISQNSDHFEFYWFPHTKTVRTKRNTRLMIQDDKEPLPSLSKWFDEEFVNNDLLRTILKFGQCIPATIPKINNLIETVSSKRSYSDDSHRVYVTKRRVRFKETEYAIPIAAIPEAMRDINKMIERKKMKISFPIEIRNAQADELFLSTAYKRQTGYIAVHRYYREDERQYFNEIWKILRSYEGRPHWGKMHDFTHSDVAAAYPKLNKFLEIRNRLDPNRVFSNQYLDRILGK